MIGTSFTEQYGAERLIVDSSIFILAEVAGFPSMALPWKGSGR